MLNRQLLDMLHCPVAPHHQLRLEDAKWDGNNVTSGRLFCDRQGLSFSITYGVPDLIPHHLLSDEKWKLWKDHLDGFQARREQRIKEPEKVIAKLSNKSRPKGYFADFIGITEGVILDIGCGSGDFRHNFDVKVQYVGLDPILLPDAEDFPFVRALAEYLPFADDTFTDVVSLSAIDHFRELDPFFREVIRVLKPGGRLHILQSIHEMRGPMSAVKMLAHFIKDRLEDRATRVKNPNAPKHFSEFNQRSLRKSANTYFDIVALERYSHRWYSPAKVFMTLKPRKKWDNE